MAHSHESWWFKRTGVINLVLVLGILAVMMGLGPFDLPDWSVVVLLVAVILMSIGLTAKRMRVESRLARKMWSALTRRSQ
ncbi:MAG: hypothetical protein AB7H88_06160 [Vicinamibacterales bacterium]